MRLRLWQQLFLVLAALVLATQLVTLWAQQQVFGRGLLDYLNGLDRQQALTVVEHLVAAYAQDQGFDSLTATPGRFRQLVLRAAQPGGDLDRGRALPPDSPRRPPREAFGDAGAQRSRPPPGAGSADLFARLQLQGPDGRVLGGNPRLQVGEPLDIVVEGRIVGRLLLAPLPQVSDAATLAFAEQQARAMTLMALGILLATLPLSWLMAQRLTRPLRHVLEAARALAAGRTAPRVAIRGHDELAELAQDFNRLAEQLARHQHLRQQWMADVSHELRTPIAVLRGELEAITCGLRVADAAAMKSLGAEAERLSTLVDDLFQLSLADLGALDYRFEILDLREVAQASVAAHVRTLADAGLRATLRLSEQPAWVRADPRRLRQLCDNLLVNSARYTDRGGQVEVGVQQAGDAVRLQVDDTAPGVDAERRSQLFERFYRVEASRGRRHGGAGLGLSICKAIADAHDARLDADASPLGGLRITLTLPRTRSP